MVCGLKPRPSGEVAASADGEGFVGLSFSAVWSNFFFQAKKKEAKKSLVTTTAAVSRAKAPGRNYKLLPALATNSPPDYSLNASRPQRFKVSEKLRRVAPLNAFWVSELINACFLTVGAVVPDCPIKMAAGASPRPTKEVVVIWQNEIILFMLYYLLLPETTI